MRIRQCCPMRRFNRVRLIVGVNQLCSLRSANGTRNSAARASQICCLGPFDHTWSHSRQRNHRSWLSELMSGNRIGGRFSHFGQQGNSRRSLSRLLVVAIRGPKGFLRLSDGIWFMSWRTDEPDRTVAVFFGAGLCQNEIGCQAPVDRGLEITQVVLKDYTTPGSKPSELSPRTGAFRNR